MIIFPLTVSSCGYPHIVRHTTIFSIFLPLGLGGLRTCVTGCQGTRKELMRHLKQEVGEPCSLWNMKNGGAVAATEHGAYCEEKSIEHQDGF